MVFHGAQLFHFHVIVGMHTMIRGMNSRGA